MAQINMIALIHNIKMRKNFTKFESAFKYEDLRIQLSAFTSLSAYSFTKKDNSNEFNNLLSLLPEGYVNKQMKNIESIDLVYSGSIEAPFLLTLSVGRNDTFQGKECYDIDVINIAPDTGTTGSYFSQIWHHFKDQEGNRITYEIHPLIITEEEKRKDITYATFLTGSTEYSNFEQYQKEKPDFYSIHQKSFEELKY